MAGAPVKGLKLDPNLLQFEFKPSIGIVAKRIDKLGVDIRSFREPLKRAVQQVMIPSIRKNFDEEGRPNPWEPLSEYTVKLRGNDSPILDRSGKLKRNMGFLSIWTITPTFATIKDLPQRIWYGKLQQAGFGGFAAVVQRHQVDFREALSHVGTSSDAKVHMPARPFVMIQSEDSDAITAVFSKWLDERITRQLAMMR